jgi:uroporphyrinogen-III synthase
MNTLQHITALITRPSPQGEILCNILRQAGGDPIFFPAIEIISLTDSPAFTQAIAAIDTLDWLIFISPQAVEQAAMPIQIRWPSFPANVNVAALGGGTAMALTKANLPVHVYPAHDWESEGLLALPDFQEISEKKIGLVQGEGGRRLLAEELMRRGAQISYLIAYRRCLPAVDVNHYLKLLNEKKIDVIISTSNEILQNITILLGQAGADLYSVPLVVIGRRMVEQAKKLGFCTILLAKNASHDAIMAVLLYASSGLRKKFSEHP